MGLHSVQLVSLACITLLVTAVSGARMREWQCRHNASTGVSIDYRITTKLLFSMCVVVSYTASTPCTSE